MRRGRFAVLATTVALSAGVLVGGVAVAAPVARPTVGGPAAAPAARSIQM